MAVPRADGDTLSSRLVMQNRPGKCREKGGGFMRDFLPILLVLFGGVYGFLSSTRKGQRWDTVRRGLVQSPMLSLGAALGILIVVLGFSWGSHQLASWLYGTGVPTRDDLRTARMLILLPIVLPLLAIGLWAWWQGRRILRDSLRREQYRPKFVDPSREQRIELGDRQGGTSA
jgi:hypothetical protein